MKTRWPDINEVEYAHIVEGKGRIELAQWSSDYISFWFLWRPCDCRISTKCVAGWFGVDQWPWLTVVCLYTDLSWIKKVINLLVKVLFGSFRALVVPPHQGEIGLNMNFIAICNHLACDGNERTTLLPQLLFACSQGRPRGHADRRLSRPIVDWMSDASEPLLDLVCVTVSDAIHIILV